MEKSPGPCKPLVQLEEVRISRSHLRFVGLFPYVALWLKLVENDLFLRQLRLLGKHHLMGLLGLLASLRFPRPGHSKKHNRHRL